MPEILDIIDLDDLIIGQATREDIYAQKHRHRIVHIMVRDTNGNFLLQMRAPTVTYLPLHWVTAASGHVQTWETYEAAGLRELEEEIGIAGTLTYLGKDLIIKDDGHEKFIGMFELILTDDLILGEEVSETRFFSPEETNELIMNGDKVHPDLKFFWEKIYLPHENSR